MRRCSGWGRFRACPLGDLHGGEKLILAATNQHHRWTFLAYSISQCAFSRFSVGDFPLVNGQPIGQQARKLSDNDVVQLAGVKMGFFAA